MGSQALRLLCPLPRLSLRLEGWITWVTGFWHSQVRSRPDLSGRKSEGMVRSSAPFRIVRHFRFHIR